MNTRHAIVRAQQRGIPPMIDMILDLYGKEEHAEGVIIRFLNKSSIRQMENDFGRRAASRLSDWYGVYKVVALDGHTITIGHRTRRINRK